MASAGREIQHERVRLSAWKGHPEEIGERAQELSDLIEKEVVNNPMMQPAPAAWIYGHEREREFGDDLQAFTQALRDGGLDGMRGAAFEFADPLDSVSGELRFDRQDDSAVVLHLWGENSVAVSGIAQSMRRSLEHGKRAIPRGSMLPYYGLIATLLVLFAGMIVGPEEGLATAFAIALGVSFGLSVLWLTLVPLLVPKLELLREGEESRISKLGIRASALFWIAVGAAIVKIIEAL